MSTVVIATNESFQVTLSKETEYFEVTQYDKDEWLTTVQKTWKLYDATYNFGTDKIGENPMGPLIKEWGNNTARIIEEEGGHAQVLKLNDVDDTYVDMNIFFLNQTYGTIEFYLKYNNSGGADRLMIEGKQDFSKKFSLMYVANLSKWMFYINNSYSEVPGLTSINDDEWHHLAIHFECGNSTYRGLAGDTTKVVLDNNNTGWFSFDARADYINDLYLTTNRTNANYSYFIDAIGFSWDDDYSVGDNINSWEIVSTLPSTWFEGESETINSQAKYMTRGWVDTSWTMYDVLRSIFLQDDFLLFMAIEDLGYNETEINNNYTDTFQLWYGLRVFWNFTIGEIQEEPSDTGSRVFIFQNPEDYKKILDDYYHFLGVIKNDTDIPKTIRDEFSNFTADDFMWHLVMSGLGVANPFDTYLTTVVEELGCENATVNGNKLTLDRIGESKYSIEVTYGTQGTHTSFVVKNEGGITIFEVVSKGNNIFVFYVTLGVMAILLVALMSLILIIRKRKFSR
jgi:hypothetical protein